MLFYWCNKCSTGLRPIIALKSQDPFLFSCCCCWSKTFVRILKSDIFLRASKHQLLDEMNKRGPNQARTIFIFLITPTTTRLLAGYLYTMGTQKAAKILKQKFIFQLGTHGINERLSFHLFIH